MAIYSCKKKQMKRSDGRSAVACASYRSGERLHDERYGETCSFPRRERINATLILAPDDAPEWATDRQELWNKVEASETRKNSQFACEYDIALPKELSLDQCTSLVGEFCRTRFVARGMVADIAIHDHGKKNPHFHVMLTKRELSPDGFGAKNREWDSKKALQETRALWADMTNQHLEQAGFDARIDHRTLEAQGNEHLPTKHMGVEASEMEARGVLTDLGDHNRAVKLHNEYLDKIKVFAEEEAHYRRQRHHQLIEENKLKISLLQSVHTQTLNTAFKDADTVARNLNAMDLDSVRSMEVEGSELGKLNGFSFLGFNTRRRKDAESASRQVIEQYIHLEEARTVLEQYQEFEYQTEIESLELQEQGLTPFEHEKTQEYEHTR